MDLKDHRGLDQALVRRAVYEASEEAEFLAECWCMSDRWPGPCWMDEVMPEDPSEGSEQARQP